MKPSDWLNSVLNGDIPLESAPPAIQSWARFPLYKKACQILDMPKADRADEINRAPAKIRQHLEAEVIRVWQMRRDLY